VRLMRIWPANPPRRSRWHHLAEHRRKQRLGRCSTRAERDSSAPPMTSGNFADDRIIATNCRDGADARGDTDLTPSLSDRGPDRSGDRSGPSVPLSSNCVFWMDGPARLSSWRERSRSRHFAIGTVPFGPNRKARRSRRALRKYSHRGGLRQRPRLVSRATQDSLATAG
jgi:hypothetical protein